MKKLNVIIGKRQLILAGLVVVLGVAVYLNWEFSQKDINLGSLNDKVYGETQETAANLSEDGKAYFAQARVNRQKSRDEAIESVKTMLTDATLTEAQKKEISEKATKLAQLSECESAIEELVKAKGFEQCVAFINDDSASVVVNSSGLTTEQAAQIFEIVLSKSQVSADKINVVEVK